MCGICGIFNFGKEAGGVNENLLDSMSEILKHRGPDGQGKYLGFEINQGIFRVGLGHRRLSIVDLTTGRQPMHNEKQTLWIVCDGEIYNHKDLRTICEKKGHKFYTKCDTETILHLYEDYGTDCVKYLRGMFAFAIWDADKKKIFLARDRLGLKPIYYTFYNNNFIFASEIKAILLHNIKRSLNWEAFNNFLVFSTTPAPLTFFEGIYKLASGHRMMISEDGNHLTEEYWDLFDNPNRISLKSDDDYIRYVHDSLDEAVRCHVTENASHAIFLSGGVDSSLITAFLSKYIMGLNTLTTGFDNAGVYNELKYAQKISKLFKTEHDEILLKKQDFSTTIFQKLMYYQEEPILGQACVPYYLISKLARAKNAVVSYVGEGGDELFLGYPSWQKVLKYRKYLEGISMLPTFFRNLLLASFRLLGADNYKYEILSRAHNKEPLFWGSNEVFFKLERDSIFSKKITNKFNHEIPSDIVTKYYKRFMEKSCVKDYGCFMSYLDFKIKMPESFLMRMDRMGMANSLEIRIPFLDYKFVESAISIPQNLKIKNNISKYILKKIAEAVLPKELVYRRKRGWGEATIQWYFDTTQEGSIIKNKVNLFNNRTGFFNPKYIGWLMRKDNKIRNKIKLWKLFSFILWYERWVDRK